MEGITSEQIQDLRRRVLNKESYTDTELREAIKAISGDRLRELEKATKPKATRKKVVPIVDLDDMLPG